MDSSTFSKITTVLYQYIGIPLYVLGNIGNIFILLIFSQKTWRKNVCVFYLLICLLLDSIYINSTVLGSIFINGFNIDLTSSNVVFCKIYNYLLLFLPTLSSTILILASIDRLLISSQNVETRLYSSRRLAYLLVSTGTTFWLIFFFHVLIKFNVQQFGPSVSTCLFSTMDFYRSFLIYSLLTINVLSFVLMIVLSTLSFQNVRHIRSIPRRQRQTIRTMRKKDFQLLRCLFAKDIIYITCNSVLVVSTIYRSIPKSQIQTSWDRNRDLFILNVGALMYHIPSCVGFYIYVVISKAFRQSFKRLIWKLFGKDVAIIREEEHNEQEIKREAKESIAISTIIT